MVNGLIEKTETKFFVRDGTKSLETQLKVLVPDASKGLRRQVREDPSRPRALHWPWTLGRPSLVPSQTKAFGSASNQYIWLRLESKPMVGSTLLILLKS